AAFSCFIPATPPDPSGEARGRFAFVDVLRMVRNRPFLLLLIVSFVLSLVNPFVYPQAASFLKLRGVSEAGVAPLLSLGQMGEVLAFLMLGRALHRYGYRTLFLVGIAAFAVRFGVWSLDLPLALVIAVIPLHGVSYAYFTGLGQTYTHQLAAGDI